MEDYIAITKFNDFIFCPYSLFLKSIYDNFTNKVYHAAPQTRGKIVHDKLDKAKYSTVKHHLQGKAVYSEKLHIMGKIDFFNIKLGLLRERKYKVHRVFLGHKYQLWAQQFALQEMGYEVKVIDLYSLSDNRHYLLPLGDTKEHQDIFDLSLAMRYWTPNSPHQPNPNKCNECIYKSLCERYSGDA